MMKLDNFVGMMTGHFDNKDQFKKMQAEGKTYPYAEHVNTICNDKINNLPEDFKGKFVVEESCYEMWVYIKIVPHFSKKAGNFLASWVQRSTSRSGTHNPRAHARTRSIKCGTPEPPLSKPTGMCYNIMLYRANPARICPSCVRKERERQNILETRNF